jgi:hypothetical protein
MIAWIALVVAIVDLVGLVAFRLYILRREGI